MKADVHSSSSGAGSGSDENLSSSDISSERGSNQSNDYEDIYEVKFDINN